ncbi:MAG: hypothetical protein M3Z57_00165 [Candidatus Dormibacteraeota bacterium]|nr:hypothetical protein [Candidatus Dormibacteraeota bacterium]
MSEHITSDEPYLLVEEVAERLGLPLSVLLHRVEAGDIPARRVERADGLHYALRLGDLGIELDDRGLRSAAIDDEASPPQHDEAVSAGQETVASGEPSVETAIFSAFDSGPSSVPGTGNGRLEVHAADAGEPGSLDPAPGEAPAWGASSQAAERPWQPAAEPPPPWALRPREPQQPPVWLTEESTPDTAEAGATDAGATDAVAMSGAATETEDVEVAEVVELVDAAPADEYLPPAFDRDEDEEAGDGLPVLAPSFHHQAADQLEDDDEDTAVAELAVPPPGREPVSLVDAAASGPRGDLASMSLDARELVAGLLDRWERTLEQRIYTEQRQRFQAELVARQNMVKQLQMELHTARAEHAAAQAEKDRLLAGKERELADRERDLAQTRRLAEEAERLVAPAASRRRRWFWNRDD